MNNYVKEIHNKSRFVETIKNSIGTKALKHVEEIRRDIAKEFIKPGDKQ